MPKATTQQKLPYSVEASTIYRYGDLCFFPASLKFTFSNPSGGAAPETIAEGFRPIDYQISTLSSGINNGPRMQVGFGNTGGIQYWAAGTASNTVLNGLFVYVTGDDFPS